MSVVNAISRLGGLLISFFERVGKATVFIFHTVIAIITPPYSFHLLLRQLYHVGATSILVIALIGFFTGAVLGEQGEYTLSQFGATAYIGSMVALSLIRELGPVLTALMVIGRAGSAMTAEIGIMRITEQIDALRSMAVDPTRYLMAPRVLAGIIAMPLLTCIFDVVGIFGGYVVSVGLLGLSGGTFMGRMIAAVDMLDITSGLIKAIVFGFIFGWVSCYKGYTCGFGSVGVNKATTGSVVTSSVAVLVVDYFLTTIINNVFMGG